MRECSCHVKCKWDILQEDETCGVKIWKWVYWSCQLDSGFLGYDGALLDVWSPMYRRIVVPSSSRVKLFFLDCSTPEAEGTLILQNVGNFEPNSRTSRHTTPALPATWVLEPQVLHLIIYLFSSGWDRSFSLHWAVSYSRLTMSTVCLGKSQKEERCCWNWMRSYVTQNIGHTRMSGTAVLWFV
jgi:hypothetical protein